MPYSAFEMCTIEVDHKHKRAARIKCGHCSEEETVAVNTMQRSGGDDEEVIERMVGQKFEKHGWKVAKVAVQHRCPRCFTAIKATNARKHKEDHKMDNKVVPINAEAPRTMTRDERRIIFEKLNDVYVSEKVGYMEDWNDEKVAKDLGVARAWVSGLREEMFGPDINEQSTRVIAEAREVMGEIKAVAESTVSVVKSLQSLVARASTIEQSLKKMIGN